jgi:hypothetical protein
LCKPERNHNYYYHSLPATTIYFASGTEGGGHPEVRYIIMVMVVFWFWQFASGISYVKLLLVGGGGGSEPGVLAAAANVTRKGVLDFSNRKRHCMTTRRIYLLPVPVAVAYMILRT